MQFWLHSSTSKLLSLSVPQFIGKMRVKILTLALMRELNNIQNIKASAQHLALSKVGINGSHFIMINF